MRPSPLLAPLLSIALAGGLVVACSGSDDDKDGDDPQETDGGVETDDTTPDGDSTDEPEETDETDVASDTDLGDPCLAAGAPVVQIGTGADDYEPLTAGQRFVMVHGPQGGWHVDLALRVDNMPQRVRVAYQLTDVASGTDFTKEPGADLKQLVAEVPGAWQCRGSLPGIVGFVDPEPLLGTGPDDDDVWEVLCGDEVEFTVIVSTTNGTELGRDSVVVNVQPDPCDCTWCGSDAGDTPACPMGSHLYDPSYPGDPICERPVDDTDTDAP